MGLLISPEELAEILGDVTVLDVRYQLGRSDGHEEYLAPVRPPQLVADVQHGHGAQDVRQLLG